MRDMQTVKGHFEWKTFRARMLSLNYRKAVFSSATTGSNKQRSGVPSDINRLHQRRAVQTKGDHGFFRQSLETPLQYHRAVCGSWHILKVASTRIIRIGSPTAPSSCAKRDDGGRRCVTTLHLCLRCFLSHVLRYSQSFQCSCFCHCCCSIFSVVMYWHCINGSYQTRPGF